MLRWFVRSLALATCLTGCVLTPIDLSGRRCDEMDRCAEGYACDLATRTCVRGEPLDAGLDARSLDADPGRRDSPELDALMPDVARDAPPAPPVDAGPSDAAARDAGPSDAGPSDAGSSDAAIDAGAPTCAPACHAAEICVATDRCELRPYAPRTDDMGAGRPESLASGMIDLTTLPASVPVVRIDASTAVGRGNCIIRLPVRAASNPLVVTNEGGQVQCARLILQGGSHWVLTGRFEGAAGVMRTGHTAFPGHADGYGSTRGTYGFLVSEELVVDLDDAAVAPAGFEIEYVELTQASSGTGRGLVVVSGRPGAIVVDGASIHDCYVHDTGSDADIGVRDVPTDVTITRLAFYRNRVLRAGGTCFRGLGLGDGSVIRENVFGGCGLGAAEEGSTVRDSPVQLEVRSGRVRFHRNVVVGSRARALSFVDVGAASDSAAEVEVTESAFSALGDDGLYIESETSMLRGSSLRVSNTSFAGFHFARTELVATATRPTSLLDVGTNGESISTVLENVRWDMSFEPLSAFPGSYTRGTPLGTTGRGSPPIVTFASFLPAALDTVAELVLLERWAAARLRPTPGADPRTYLAGRFVVHLGSAFEASTETSLAPGAPDWSTRGVPVDDVRTSGDYAAMGIGP